MRGREPGYVVVGAHYDTKDIPGFVGANDGASGTAVLVQLARTIKRPRHTIKFILFDGEESPRGTPDPPFEQRGLRGAKVAAPALPRRPGDGAARLRRRPAPEHPARGLLGPGAVEPAARGGAGGRAWRATSRPTRAARSWTTTSPSSSRACPSIDLIDFDFPCWHRRCDDLSSVSERSLDATGEAVYRFLASL